MASVEPIRNTEDIRKIENILKAKSKRDLLLFTLGINSGLRVSDILALNVGDVKNKSHIQITEQKTGKFKKFPINSKLKPMIAEFTKNKNIQEPLFKTIFGNRMNRITVYKILNDACNKAGLNILIGTHTMRKTFGYHHYKQFRDVAMLQMIFNHSNPRVTLRYIGISQDEIEESYKKFIL